MGTSAPEKWIVTEPRRIIRPAIPPLEAPTAPPNVPAVPLPERELIPA